MSTIVKYFVALYLLINASTYGYTTFTWVISIKSMLLLIMKGFFPLFLFSKFKFCLCYSTYGNMRRCCRIRNSPISLLFSLFLFKVGKIHVGHVHGKSRKLDRRYFVIHNKMNLTLIR